MFLFLAAILTYAYLTFGAVGRQDWLLLSLFCILAIALLLGARTILRGSLDLRELLWFMPFIVAVALFQAKLALPIFCLAWAVVASRKTQDRSRRVQDSRMSFYKFLMTLGVFEALVGLAQYFIKPGWILGYQSAYAVVSGTLINQNHFAGLMATLVAVGLGCAYIEVAEGKDIGLVYLYVLATAAMALALIFSLSRMGIASLGVGVLSMLSILRLRYAQRKLGTVLILSLTVMIASAALGIGIQVVVDRYKLLLEEDAVLREGRMLVFRDTIRLIRDNPGGIGIGNYRDIFRQYQTFRPNLLFDHAHNDYLETAAEWGILFSVTFWATWCWFLFKIGRQIVESHNPREIGILLSAFGSSCSILFHSVADFNLQIPANSMLLFSIGGVVFATMEARRRAT